MATSSEYLKCPTSQRDPHCLVAMEYRELRHKPTPFFTRHFFKRYYRTAIFVQMICMYNLIKKSIT